MCSQLKRVLAATGNHFNETVIQCCGAQPWQHPGLPDCPRRPNVRRAIAPGAGYRISAAPAGSSLSSWRSVTWKNCARTQRCHGVTRIVTISCTDSNDARWRRQLAKTIGAGKRSDRWRREHRGLVRETRRRVDLRMRHLTLLAWRKLRLTEKIVPTGDSGTRRKPVSIANARPEGACPISADNIDRRRECYFVLRPSK